MNDIWFGPVVLEPINPSDSLRSESLEVGMLLPAVQIASDPAARLDVMGNGLALSLPAFGKEERSLVKFRIWIDREATAGGLILSVEDPSGRLHLLPIEHKELVIRVRETIQSDRTLVGAETASVRHNTVGSIATPEGTEPILIGMLLPAIQKVR